MHSCMRTCFVCACEVLISVSSCMYMFFCMHKYLLMSVYAAVCQVCEIVPF